MITRLIHQTFPSKELPFDLMELVDRLKFNNPEYKHKLYSDYDIENFISLHYGEEVNRAYYKINPEYGPARSDFFRYLVLYKFGGIYIDIKTGFKRPLREIISDDDEYLISSWPDAYWEPRLKTGYGEYQNLFIGCAPNHPFLLAVINQCIKNINTANPQAAGKFDVTKITGPLMYTSVIHPMIKSGNYKFTFKPKNYNGDLKPSLLKNLSSHKKYYKTHYSELKSPIILQ
jgi:mannosyltransferase OCH1-like enzyme